MTIRSQVAREQKGDDAWGWLNPGAVDLRANDARAGIWKGLRETRKEAVVRLRREGLRLSDIAEGLGIAATTASMDLYMSGEARLLRQDHRELAARREAVARELDPDEYVVEWRLRSAERRRRNVRAHDLDRRWWRAFTYPLPLDAAIPGTDGGVLRRDTVAGPPGDDPAVALEQAEVSEILNDLALEDVSRMDEHQLSGLRERLLGAGVVPSSVQRLERERLRTPQRHRGEGPSPMRERKSPRHRGRKAQKVLMAGKRTSRTPRKRWEREAA